MNGLTIALIVALVIIVALIVYFLLIKKQQQPSAQRFTMTIYPAPPCSTVTTIGTITYTYVPRYTYTNTVTYTPPIQTTTYTVTNTQTTQPIATYTCLWRTPVKQNDKKRLYSFSYYFIFYNYSTVVTLFHKSIT